MYACMYDCFMHVWAIAFVHVGIGARMYTCMVQLVLAPLGRDEFGHLLPGGHPAWCPLHLQCDDDDDDDEKMMMAPASSPGKQDTMPHSPSCS